MSPAQQLHEAVKSGDEKQVAALLDADAGLIEGGGAAGMAPLMVAVYSGRREIAAMLIARGAKLDQFAAAALGHLDVLRAGLAAPEANIEMHSADGWTVLHLAAFFGQLPAAELLIELGASVKSRSANTMSNTPLHAAAAGRHVEICALLLTHNADVNATQSGNYTPLHSAAANGDEALVRLLLSHQADPHIRSEKGETPLDLARARKQQDVCALLESTPR